MPAPTKAPSATVSGIQSSMVNHSQLKVKIECLTSLISQKAGDSEQNALSKGPGTVGSSPSASRRGLWKAGEIYGSDCSTLTYASALRMEALIYGSFDECPT